MPPTGIADSRVCSFPVVLGACFISGRILSCLKPQPEDRFGRRSSTPFAFPERVAPECLIGPFDRFHPACRLMLLCQRANRKLSYGRGEHPRPLPAGSFCGGGGAALDAARFAVSVGRSQNAQMARALAVAPGHRVPFSVSAPRDLLARGAGPPLLARGGAELIGMRGTSHPALKQPELSRRCRSSPQAGPAWLTS